MGDRLSTWLQVVSNNLLIIRENSFVVGSLAQLMANYVDSTKGRQMDIMCAQGDTLSRTACHKCMNYSHHENHETHPNRATPLQVVALNDR